MNAKATNADRAKKPMSNKKYLGIWVPVLATVTVVTVVANVGLNVAGGWVASQLGSGTYTFTNAEKSAEWDTDYYTSDLASIDSVDSPLLATKFELTKLPLAPLSSSPTAGRPASVPSSLINVRFFVCALPSCSTVTLSGGPGPSGDTGGSECGGFGLCPSVGVESMPAVDD